MESFLIALASFGLLVSWASSTSPVHTASVSSPSPVLELHAAAPVCGGGPLSAVATRNAATLKTAALAPFGRPEQGWEIYEMQVAHTIGTPCAAETTGFAARLASWQSRNHLNPTGAVDAATLGALKQKWQHARPFIAAFAEGDCPEAADAAQLVAIAPKEGWGRKPGQLDARTLAALRQMVAAARAEDPAIAADPQMLTIVSAFRSPAYDAAKCATGANCNGIAKAKCSAHRTGTAVDLYVGAMPGESPVSSADANRLFQTQTPTYRWLVKNASRFGFVNYVFEPWHWEYTGAPVEPAHDDRVLIRASLAPVQAGAAPRTDAFKRLVEAALSVANRPNRGSGAVGVN